MSIQTEIIRRFLNGSTMNAIQRGLGVDQKTILRVLSENVATREVLKDYLEKHERGEFVMFFYSSKPGRSKLSPEKQRKIRQIRISDEEMERLGNPSTTRMREMLLKYRQIEDFLSYLDRNGVNLFPEEIFHSRLNPNDEFWKDHFYGRNHKVLEELARSPRLWEQAVSKMIGKEDSE